MNAQALGQRIADARRARSMKREKLAVEAELSMATVAKLEAGHYLPRIDTLSKIAKALGVSVAALLSEPQPLRPATKAA